MGVRKEGELRRKRCGKVEIGNNRGERIGMVKRKDRHFQRGRRGERIRERYGRRRDEEGTTCTEKRRGEKRTSANREG